jgi:hypothetical protein
MRTLRCPECQRVASVPDWCERPICMHAWDGMTPEVWDGNNTGFDAGTIEKSRLESMRTPGPRTWSEMVEL